MRKRLIVIVHNPTPLLFFYHRNVIAAALSTAVIVIILIVFIWQFCYTRRLNRITNTTKTGDDNFQSGIEKLPMTNDSCKDPDSFSGFQLPEVKGRPSYSLFRIGILPKISFNWADHLLRLDRIYWTDITWELCPESVDFMQKIKFNPVLKKISGGGFLLKELPGSHLGSIGFNSTGSLFLDGIKLVFEAEKTEWESKGKVISCGFDPSQKKVFCTVDSELVHVINCKSEEFSNPLYPTIAANVNITVMVNFGQSAFKYSPANAQRTPNPCFICPPKGSPGVVGYEDSRDLFSMGIVPYSSWNNNNGDIMSPDHTEATELFKIPFSGPAMSNAGT
ncbi:hypothetical protein NE237_029131 [Protea cynaroides]|uniref:Uncharacterized protein n=1 Tax=Protea cynaroides TaxID=273540 RepID=A0A9Q0GV80_9MAGN|nr:hypothetical protein NE237_029131 [Protea cynaroides]